jgi:hypothetical protein
LILVLILVVALWLHALAAGTALGRVHASNALSDASSAVGLCSSDHHGECKYEKLHVDFGGVMEVEL